jgi:hypothetical protein
MCICEKKRDETIQIRVDVTIYLFFSHGAKVAATVQKVNNSLMQWYKNRTSILTALSMDIVTYTTLFTSN